jgi:hypothetical protein
MAVTAREKDRGARGIRIAGEHQQLTLPGMLWPAGRDRARSAPLFFEAISKEQANELTPRSVTRWRTTTARSAARRTDWRLTGRPSP